jgi:hypothetical protein
MQDHPRNAVLESWYVRALDKFLSSMAEDFTIRSAASAPLTTIEVPAGVDRADGHAAAISVNGLWRFRDTTVQRAHPGGAAGTYLIFVVAKANSISSVPQPFTDNTDYNFDLRIVANGTTPPIVAGTVDAYRRVGNLDWDGAKITRLEQEVGDVAAGFGVRNFTFGDGIATSFNLDHNLATRFVSVEVFDNAGLYPTDDVIVERPTDNRVTIRTEGFVPTLNSLNAVIISRAATAVQPQIAHAASHLPGGSDPLAFAPVVAALPAVAAADNGRMVRFVADYTAGVEWLLVYRHYLADGVTVDPSPYKWHCIGGGKLSSQNAGPVAFAFPATYGWATMPSGPSVIAPLAGEYEMDWAVVLIATAAGGIGDVRFRPSAVTAGNISSGGWSNTSTGPINGKGSVVQAVTAGQVVTIHGATPVPNAAVTVYERIIQIRPVRVG